MKEEAAKEYAEEMKPIMGLDKYHAPYITTFEHHQDIEESFIAGANWQMSQSGTIPYLKCEYDLQIEKMKQLGINTEAQLFEQCVNTLIYMVEQKDKSSYKN